jgi:hypothetical protein
VYDLSGNLIGDYDDQGKLNSEYVYGPTGRTNQWGQTRLI